jgi:GAF domain-containing protein
MNEAREVADRLGLLAAAVGPSLAPIDHELQLTAMAEAARAVFGAEACSIALLDAEEENLVFTAASGAGAEAVIGLSVPVGVGVAGWVVGAGQSIEITEVARDPRFARDVAERTGYLPRAILAAPLETDDRILGVVEVLDRDADRPGSDRDLVLLDFFATHAAVAVESARLFGDMGRLLLRALSAVDGDGELGPQLAAAAKALEVDVDLADLAELFGELGRTGAAERRLAVQVASDVLSYARKRPPA